MLLAETCVSITAQLLTLTVNEMSAAVMPYSPYKERLNADHQENDDETKADRDLFDDDIERQSQPLLREGTNEAEDQKRDRRRGEISAGKTLSTSDAKTQKEPLWTQLKAFYRRRRLERRGQMFWVEKFLILWELWQAAGVLWALSLGWPWPRQWLQWSRYDESKILKVFDLFATLRLLCTLRLNVFHAAGFFIVLLIMSVTRHSYTLEP